MSTEKILECTAVFLNALGVFLVLRRNIWAFPVGIVGVVLYACLFYTYRLYADMGLQIVYVFLQIHGWIQWSGATRMADERVEVLRVGKREAVLSVIAVLLGTFVIAHLLSTQTNAALPWPDAAAAALSLSAQWWLNRRYLENWLLWMGANSLYLVIYFQKALFFTFGLTWVFLGLAIIGYIDWRKRVIE